MSDKIYLATKLSIIREQIASMEEEKKSIEEALMLQMDEDEEKTVELSNVRVTKVETNRVVYDIKKMKDILSKAQLKSVCDKEISIDKTALRELFCTNPELKVVLKSAIKVEYIPNAAKVKQAIDNCLVTHKELRKIAIVNTSQYLKVTKQEAAEDE